MMNDAENLNFRLSIDGESRLKRNFKKITLKNIFDAIDDKVISEDIRLKLKEKAKNYPHQALGIFFHSLDRHISDENKKTINNTNLKNNSELEFPE